MPETQGNGYPSEGLTFLGYSLIFVLKAYMGERSLRNQFKARHGIDDAKRRIEGILETMMPPKVLEELQKTAPGSCPPSHHYFRATLVQSDLVGFTRMASSKPPEAVVKAVSDLFGIWLLVWNFLTFVFFHVLVGYKLLGPISPTDFHIFQSFFSQPPNRHV